VVPCQEQGIRRANQRFTVLFKNPFMILPALPGHLPRGFQRGLKMQVQIADGVQAHFSPSPDLRIMKNRRLSSFRLNRLYQNDGLAGNY
jgi:hypothetical protein